MGRGFLSRRSFVKLSAATMAVAGLSSGGGSALAETGAPQSSDIKRIRTCCRGCGKMECGVKVIVQNGRAIRVEGDEGAFQSMGNCCTKSQSSIQAAYHPDRLHYPMKRTNPKGEEPGWQRISWDEAYERIAKKIRATDPHRFAFYVTARGVTNEIYYMSQKAARFLGTGNIDNAARICHSPSSATGCGRGSRIGRAASSRCTAPRAWPRWAPPWISSWMTGGSARTW